MSGDASAQAANRNIRRGGYDFLQKPVSKPVLLRTIQTILENVIEQVRPRWLACGLIIQQMPQENARILKSRGDRYKELLIQEVCACLLTVAKRDKSMMLSLTNQERSPALR